MVGSGMVVRSEKNVNIQLVLYLENASKLDLITTTQLVKASKYTSSRLLITLGDKGNGFQLW
jgi:hypothetical protein